MLFQPFKRIKLFSILLTLLSITCSIFPQEKAVTFFGPYYRSNQFLPLSINQQENFNAVSIENKYSSDSLIFNQDKKGEVLVKVMPDGTLFELKDPQGSKKLLNLSFQIMPEETPLVVIAGSTNQVIDTEKKRIRIVQSNIFPSISSAFEMIDVLIITDDFKETLTSAQTDAIKEWVLSGGIIIFESKTSLKKHSGLVVPLLKLTNSKFHTDSNNINMIEELNNEATRLTNLPSIAPTGYGFIGIKKIDLSTMQEELTKLSDGKIEWRLRNRNNPLAEKNSLRQEVSTTKIKLTQKVTIIYFLIFVIVALLKPSRYFLKLSCGLAFIAILPIVYFTPTNQLDSHYYQLLTKKEHFDFDLINEEIYLRQGEIPELNINIEKTLPFFATENTKIFLKKNIHGQYISQAISSKQEYVKIKKTSLSRKPIFQKIIKDKNTFFYHKLPLEKAYEVSENLVKELGHEIATSNKDGIITKLNKEIDSKSRDAFEKSIWYAASNQIFYDHLQPPESILILEGTTRIIPLEITPSLTIQKSFFTFLVIPESIKKQ